MDELFIFLCICAIFFGGFIFGKLHTYFYIGNLLKQVAEEQGIDLEKEIKQTSAPPKPRVYKLDVEEHGDMLYLFDVEKHNFICQGKTVEELCELAKQQKNVLYAAVKHGERVFQFKDGVSTEVKV